MKGTLTQHKRGPRIVVWAVSIMILGLCLWRIHGNLPLRFHEEAHKAIFAESSELLDDQINELRSLGLSLNTPVHISSLLEGDVVIHGRFLHITDMHPDPFYVEGSEIDEQCHCGTGKGSGTASKYGDAILGCDSPMVLVTKTLEWIKENLSDKIDFVVWTGDNVRHDNDRRFPRTESYIFEMNANISTIMKNTFADPNAPDELQLKLIPSLGNNDVYPHNLFSTGPTLQTREMFRIWQDYIPQSQLHTFNKGAYFFQEIIPGQLAVLSLNTLYLFQSNPLVDNCDSRKQPGYQLFEWLGSVLKELRVRNMKVWLTGHVPPSTKNYDESCLRKHIVWAYEYRDVIIGGLYGHMNIDHFIPLDSVAAYKSIKKSRKGGKKKNRSFTADESQDHDSDSGSDCDDLDGVFAPLQGFDDEIAHIRGGVPQNKVAYLDSVRETWYAGIKGKKKSGVAGERYSIAHVSPSVVPTFNPGFRIWEYNTSGLADLINSKGVQFASWDSFFAGLNVMLESRSHEVKITKKTDKTFPPKMPKGTPLGPAYVPQLFTPNRYVSYYLDLALVNNGAKDFNYEVEYATDDKLYNMLSLVVEEWLKYGRTLGAPLRTKDSELEESKVDPVLAQSMWEEYLKNSFISSNYENMGYG